jgi:hypothetical protein
MNVFIHGQSLELQAGKKISHIIVSDRYIEKPTGINNEQIL